MVCWMTEQARAGAPHEARDQAHHPLGRAAWSRTCTTGSTSTRSTATSTPRTCSSTRSGGCSLRTTLPLFFDEYRRNRETGSFILIDEGTNATVGAGMIMGPTPAVIVSCRRAPNVTWHAGEVGPEDRPFRGATVWLTGLSGSGKSTVAVALERLLVVAGPARLPARRRQPAPRPQRRPRLHRGRPHRERAAGGRGGPADGRRRASWRSCRSSAPTAPAATTPGPCTRRPTCPFVEVFVDTPDRAVRAAGPEGALRQGPGRRDHRLHRHRRPLRGPARARARPRPRGRPPPRAGREGRRAPPLTVSA